MSIFGFIQTFRFRSKVTGRLHQIGLIFQRIFNMQANTFHVTIVKNLHLHCIPVKNSKFLSSIFFPQKRPRLNLLSDDVVFSKWVFLDDKSVILLWSKNLHFFEGVNSWLSSKIPVTFGAYFSVKETSVFRLMMFFFIKRRLFRQ